MKNNFVACLCTLFACIFLTHVSFAQSYSNLPIRASLPAFTSDNAAKKNNEKPVVKIEHANVNAKVLRSFNQHCKNVQEPQWFLLGNNYFAYFEKDGRKTRALFAKNGYVFYTITYGSEQDLPAEERTLLTANYTDFKIGSVQHLYSPDHKGWVVNLQHNDRLMVVLIAERAWEVLFDSWELPVVHLRKKKK